MANHNGHWDERADRGGNDRGDGASRDRTTPRGYNDDERMRFAQHPGYHGGSAFGRTDAGFGRQDSSGHFDRGYEAGRYDRAFDRVPVHGHDDHREPARGYGGATQDNQGGFGPGIQGPYGQAAYGEGSYARGTSSYAFGSNHPYADREAHNRYNREHFPQGNYGATGQRLRGDGPGLAGPHRGKGPKNFTRSDERLKEHVNELLMEHDEIDATHVDVSVQHGEVTLTGTVEDRWQRRIIEDLIEGMSGVMDVHISLKVADRHQARRTNPEAHTSPSAASDSTPGDPKKARA